VEQLIPDFEVLQLSENTAVDNKRIEDFGPAPVPTMKDDEVLALTGGDGSINLSALQGVGVWPIRILIPFAILW
jgi:hypothetical protein